jgi:hypothetical protein
MPAAVDLRRSTFVFGSLSKFVFDLSRSRRGKLIAQAPCHPAGKGRSSFVFGIGANISIRIKTFADEYNISYDHGTGIYTIGGHAVGFVSLSPVSCKKLNALLLAKGFTKAQIGFR